MPAMQDNSRRKQAVIDIQTSVATVSALKLVSLDFVHPEQVMDFPVAFIAAGGGERKPRDLQLVYFDHEMEVVIYVCTRESVAGKLWEELEDLVKSIVDRIDADAQTLRDSQNYDLYVSNVDTDRGTLASEGARLAVAVITVTVLLPAQDVAT